MPQTAERRAQAPGRCDIGEASGDRGTETTPVLIMNYFALLGAVMGAIGAGMQMAKGK
jgi:hypothetical protein